jgi:hypothetical protein
MRTKDGTKYVARWVLLGDVVITSTDFRGVERKSTSTYTLEAYAKKVRTERTMVEWMLNPPAYGMVYTNLRVEKRVYRATKKGVESESEVLA